MTSSLGASKKYSDAVEEPGTSEVSRDLSGLEEQQAEPRKRKSANMKKLMFSTLKVIQDHMDILKSTQEMLVKDYRTPMNEVTGLKETLREENYRINIMEERISTNEDEIELQFQKIRNLSKQLFTVPKKGMDLKNTSRR